jgi:hypothetical protein
VTAAAVLLRTFNAHRGSMLLTLLHPSSSYITGQLIVVDGGLTIA